MKTGFYDIHKLSTEKLKEFFPDAVMLSYDSHVEKLPQTSWRRVGTTEKNIKEMIELANHAHHNVCIDRSVQHDSELYGEIGYSTLASDAYFLYVYVTLDNLKILTDKYNLIEQ